MTAAAPAPPPGGALGGHIALPAMLVRETALAHNLAVMARYTEERGLLLAPHGKTTMAPKLFRRQLEAGAWAITVANMAQAGVAFEAGASRVLVANELVGPWAAAQVVELLRPGDRQLYSLVDSVRGVQVFDDNLARASMAGRLDVLVELGATGARAGVRAQAEGVAVARAVAASTHLRLAGVEGFEGSLAADRSLPALAKIDRYLYEMGALAQNLADLQAFPEPGPLIISAGGSKYFDRVGEILAPVAQGLARDLGREAYVVLRSGCYLVHDHGVYAEASPLASAAGGGDDGARLWPALEVWAEVLSRPEPDLAIVGMGKRDVPYDAGLPVPVLALRAGDGGPAPFSGGHVLRLDDQHGYLALGGSAPSLEVGDRVGFGISHPCTAFDKWRSVLLVSDDYQVLDDIPTFFH